ncbi:MAG: cyclic pyranopterin monophosphate synthase MoaC [Tissierellia bacterium]|nr:cyclic pyranopterin monophosphate synthase MoaC [Tissierellia bacterium]
MTFNHFDEKGNAHMVDVSEKQITSRRAVASGSIYMKKETFHRVLKGNMKKGDVLGVARLAGIMAMKKTSDLIPLCHPLPITNSSIEFIPHEDTYSFEVVATCKVDGKTGVEMEALTGVSLALLTVYDMCKAMDKEMKISNILLKEKEGGKSGSFQRKD